MPDEELFERARELEATARRVAQAAGAGVKTSRLPAITEEVEGALRYLAMTFGRLATDVEEREVSNELFAVSELCRAAYRQSWAARHAISQLTGEPE
jgi:hypothetical protein